MKSIIIPIRPEWVVKILNGQKTLEIRKTAPREWIDYLNGKGPKPEPKDVYIYCTKNGYLHLENEGYWSYSRNQKYTYVRSGKVVAKFTLRKVTQYIAGNNMDEDHPLDGDAYIEDGVLDKACITEEALLNYTHRDDDCIYDFTFFAWHISDLVVFNEPMELGKFHTGTHPENIVVRAPQSWMYVEVAE